MDTGMALTSISKDFLESPSGIALNGFMNTIPGFNGVWVAILQANEQTKNMRILRAMDLMELFKDPDFQTMFGQSEQALDGFGLCLESIMKERNQEKRKIIKNIFLGFTKLSEEEKEKFQLERLLDITSKITISEIGLLREINDKGSIDFKSKEKTGMISGNPYIETINFYSAGKPRLNNSDTHSSGEQYIDLRYGLMSLGIIKQIDYEESTGTPLKKMGDENNKKDYFSIELTKLGQIFISYILKNES